MAWLLSVVMIFGVFVTMPITQGNAITHSDFNSKLSSLRSQYPDYSTWYDYFDGGHQCYGFARLIAYNVFGSHADDWRQSGDINGVKAGDVLQYGNTSGSGHTVFVTDVYGDTIVFVDCNGNGNYSNGTKVRTCGIKWDNMISKSDWMFGKYSFAYRLVAPDIQDYHNPIGNLDSVSSPAPNKLHIGGWAFDWDNVGKALDIHVYVGGPSGSGAPCYVISANKVRADVNGSFPGIGDYHGFDETITVGNDRTGNQAVYVYAINVDGGVHNPLLDNAPKTVNIQSVPTDYQDIGADFYGTIITGQYKLVSVDTSGNVVQMDIKDSRNQIWHFVRNSDLSYTITNLENGKCLDVSGKGTANQTNVLSYESNGGDHQKWYFIKQDGDFYSMVPRHARGMALDVDGASAAHGANIQIYEFNNTQAQKFRPYKFSTYTNPR